jgi:uncharacterized damage-inducible protein DinB
MTPEQATTLLNSMMLPWFQAERPVTARVIAAIPPDRADYRPDPVGRTALELAWHIVTTEVRFVQAVLDGRFDLTPWPVPADVRTPADVIAWSASELDGRIEQLRALPAESLTTPIDFRGMFQFPAVVYLQLAVSHSIHHRGQLSMYLRPMGAKVPSIYGESYDGRVAREAAQPSR